MSEPIRVWRFSDAPEEFQRLSEHGGDEDWVALVPEHIMADGTPTWLWSGTPFGVCDVSEHPLIDGRGTVFIGAHA